MKMALNTLRVLTLSALATTDYMRPVQTITMPSDHGIYCFTAIYSVSIHVYFEIFQVKMMNGFVLIERWANPFKLFNVIRIKHAYF
jgi:hypothetical protein